MFGTSRKSSNNDANALKWFARSFFILAAIVGVSLVVYFSKPPGEDKTLMNGGNLRQIPLPIRLPHDGHDHFAKDAEPTVGAAGKHDHGNAHQIAAVEEPFEREVTTRTYEKDGDEITEETTLYGKASALSAAELAELGPAAQSAAREGTELVVVKRRIRRAVAEPDRDEPQPRSKLPDSTGQVVPPPVKEPEATAPEPVKQNEPVEVAPPSPAQTGWKALSIPNRNQAWVPEQRPIAGERDITSHQLEESTIASSNPPPANYVDRALTPDLSDADREELSHRLVIAVALGVHHGGLNPDFGLDKMPIVKVLLTTMLPSVQPHHNYRFYFAYDHNDPVFEKERWRNEIENIFADAFAGEDAKRWHPEGSQPGSIDGSRLHYTLHWVHCGYSGKPSWAHSDAVVAAYKEGADYVYRSNDDSKFPDIGDWADRFIMELRSRQPVPNLGVVGPTCHEGANWILTHDFTHKTHVVVFGFQYPRGLPDWSSDDWITYVYGGFSLMKKLPEVVVGHTLMLGTRYEPTAKAQRLATLNAELQQGSQVLDAWLKNEKKVTVPFQVKNVDCC